MKTQGSTGRTITFEINTPIPLAVGEQVFVSGNQAELGEWKADGFPLTREDDNRWTGTVVVASREAIAYKITRGSWESEEVDENGHIPQDKRIEPGPNRRVTHRINRWKDLAPVAQPEIIGHFKVHEAFHSSYLRFDRRIVVWLPPSYEKTTRETYPVLYLLDGQNAFKTRLRDTQPGWQIDQCCTTLIEEGLMKEIIVVAVSSSEDRFIEYNPSLAGPDHTRFMMEELIPYINKEYRTIPSRTAIAGSSLGGSLAFFTAWMNPRSFFGAACLSPAFKIKNDEFLLDLIRKTDSDLPDIKLYLYCGRGEPMEAFLAEGTREAAKLLKVQGFDKKRNLLVWADPDGLHNEESWAKHIREGLIFLFHQTTASRKNPPA